ncbi:hypothetical protein T01_2392 [Trichinella spiralis]|uniref:Uncharacterized protein n=1 Tax=Trichinella spiralis TaxID=6334 RepID=A0A0V1AI84_TRISP|nr:hypothetical protein T01_2392 [Trichinella spiralis]
MKPPPHPPTPLLLSSSRVSVVYGLQSVWVQWSCFRKLPCT